VSSLPKAASSFFKAQGLGNDYLVFKPGDDWVVTPQAVRRICDRHSGVGSDGLVIVDNGAAVPALRMFNPDGSEFERSGNGLRVAAIALTRWGIATGDRFVVTSRGGDVPLQIHGQAQSGDWDVSADLGRAQVGAAAIALGTGVLDSDGRLTHPQWGTFEAVPVSVGNPHLVVFTHDLSDEALHAIGPFLASHTALGNGTNVQLAHVDKTHVRIRIWERGVGPTAASGTSASAVAVATVFSGRRAPGEQVIQMDGGDFTVTVSASLRVSLRGPIGEVAEGELTQAFLSGLG